MLGVPWGCIPFTVVPHATSFALVVTPRVPLCGGLVERGSGVGGARGLRSRCSPQRFGG